MQICLLNFSSINVAQRQPADSWGLPEHWYRVRGAPNEFRLRVRGFSRIFRDGMRPTYENSNSQLNYTARPTAILSAYIS